MYFSVVNKYKTKKYALRLSCNTVKSLKCSLHTLSFYKMLLEAKITDLPSLNVVFPAYNSLNIEKFIGIVGGLIRIKIGRGLV